VTAVAKVKPQVIEGEEHERVHERVAAVDVAKDTGMVCTRTPAPVPAGRPAQHDLDGQGPDGRGPRAGPPAEKGRHPDRDAGVDRGYLGFEQIFAVFRQLRPSRTRP
jgi:hypothetical protein